MLLGSESCSKYLCDCGSTPPDPSPAEWKPCLKRHRTLYRLRDVREPAGFVLPAARRSSRRNTKRKAGDAAVRSLEYIVPVALQAQIQHNVNVVPESEGTKPQRRNRNRHKGS